MKRIYLIILLCTITGLSQSFACEICGCGVGNFYIGIMPKFNSQFIGVRYRTMHFKTQMRDDPSEYSNDYYKTIEMWGGWNVGKRIQLLAFVPYQMNNRVTDDGEKSSNGLGDITVLANYNIWKSLNGNQRLWLGGGAKLPIGKYKIDFSDSENNLGDPNAQSGTGSLDFIININHTVSINKWGINTSMNYKMNTANSDQYKFGNRFSANTLGYYRLTVRTFNIAPVAGVLFEQSAGNAYKNSEVELTGGYAVLASSGLEMSYNKMAVGVSVQAPLNQNFAEHQTEAKPRGMVHLTFTL